MSDRKISNLIPARKTQVGFLVAFLLVATSPVAMAAKFNWSGAAQGAADWAERGQDLDNQKKLIEYQYELERQRLQRQFDLEEQAKRRAQEQQRIAEEKARQAAEEAKRNALSTGTGFFVTNDGYLITNHHVISDKNTYAIRDSKGRYYRANVVARDQAKDLALLKIDGRFPALKIGNSDAVTKGQRVLAVGYPQISIQGNESKVTDGIVNSLSGLRNDDDWFQISVPIQGGNSGGPLVSENGIVYGVVVATLNASKVMAATGNLPQNVNYAIKSKLVLDFLAMERVRNSPTISCKANIADVDSASVLIIAKNGPIDVAYQSAPIDRAAEARLAQQAQVAEKARQAEDAKHAREAAAAEKLRLAEETKQAKLIAAEEAKKSKEVAAAEKIRLAEEAKLAQKIAAAEQARIAEESKQAQRAAATEKLRLAQQDKLARLEKQKREAEIRKLTTTHPEWESDIKTKEFAFWRENIIPNGKELMMSEDAQFISRHLTQFKAWKRGVSSDSKLNSNNNNQLAPAPTNSPKFAAEQGHTDAQHDLAMRYLTGDQGRDEVQAIKLFRKAANQGFAPSQHVLGDFYKYGAGNLVPKDEAESIKWYQLAADQNLPQSQYALGLAYAYGQSGLAQNESEAVKWYRLAATQDHAEAQNNLAIMYAYGRGVEKNDNEAALWFRKAADKGIKYSQHGLGEMYATGRGGLTQSNAEAALWYRKAAEQGYDEAQFKLAEMYRNGPNGFPRDTNQARVWYQKAAAQDHEKSKNRLAGPELP